MRVKNKDLVPLSTTVKVSDDVHQDLKLLKHHFFEERINEVIRRLIDEYKKKFEG